MEQSQPIRARETERMMKLQAVILKAMARKLTWIEAAEIAGMSVRNMQRMRARYQEHGYSGLFDQRRGTERPLRAYGDGGKGAGAVTNDSGFMLGCSHGRS